MIKSPETQLTRAQLYPNVIEEPLKFCSSSSPAGKGGGGGIPNHLPFNRSTTFDPRPHRQIHVTTIGYCREITDRWMLMENMVAGASSCVDMKTNDDDEDADLLGEIGSLNRVKGV